VGGSAGDEERWFEEGETAILTAVASNGYEFVGWQGDIPGYYSEDNPLSLVMDSERQVRALFWDKSTVLARHWVKGGAYFPGINEVQCTFFMPDVKDLLSLEWTPKLPDGWTLVRASGDGNPRVLGENLVFLGRILSNPAKFNYMVLVPVDETATCSIEDVAAYVVNGGVNPTPVQALPQPLVIDLQSDGYHSADYQDSRWVIDATELNRVLSYWRAGGYVPNPEGYDGYAPSAIPHEGAQTVRHSADFMKLYWKINVREANRMLAYWRAGGYRIDPDGVDGYAPIRLVPFEPKPFGASLFSAGPVSVSSSGESGYVPGETVTITNEVSFDESLMGLAVQYDLPEGWEIINVVAAGSPEWTEDQILWTGAMPASPVTIIITLSVPIGCRGDKSLSGTVDAYVAESINGSEVYVPPTAMQMEFDDADGDGIPDAWEVRFAGDANLMMADVDTDLDGHSNRDEWFAGTDPTNSASVLSITGVGYTGDDARILYWQSAIDRHYSVLFASNLLMEASVVTNGIPATIPINSIEVPAEWPSDGFFMIKVEE